MSSGIIEPHIFAESIHVVLVEPGDSLNIGSVARAMMNLGFVHLHLVSPPRFDLERAKITACWAAEFLEKAHIHADLTEALKPMRAVVGFSVRDGKNRATQTTLSAWAQDLKPQSLGATALLFGPEDSGLRHEHIEHCSQVVRIPSTEAYPAFNLAHSVLLALYEIFRVSPSYVKQQAEDDRPCWEEFYQLDKLLADIATKSEFFNAGTPPSVPGFLKTLCRRMEPNRREMALLLGLFSRIAKTMEVK